MPPLWLRVPAKSGLPRDLETGIDSPVREDSSTLVLPSEHAVHRDLLAGTDDDDLADFQILDGDHVSPSPFTRASLGPQREQRFDGLLRAFHGVALEHVGKAEEKQQQRAFKRLPDDRRAQCGEHHQHIDVEASRAARRWRSARLIGRKRVGPGIEPVRRAPFSDQMIGDERRGEEKEADDAGDFLVKVAGGGAAIASA